MINVVDRKVFASVPYSINGMLGFVELEYSFITGNKASSMLEIKLLILIDLPTRMNAGVFLACSDDIEFFESGGDFLIDFTSPGVTALAHPGSVEIGRSHGVFVVSSPKEKENSLHSCVRFLHKPSQQLMQEAGAILPSGQVFICVGAQNLRINRFIWTVVFILPWTSLSFYSKYV